MDQKKGSIPLSLRAAPKDAAKVATATMATFFDPDKFRDCCIGARYDRQENPSKQFHDLRPLQLTGYQFSWVDVEFQAFRLVQ